MYPDNGRRLRALHHNPENTRPRRYSVILVVTQLQHRPGVASLPQRYSGIGHYWTASECIV